MKLVVLGGWGQLGTDLALAAEGRHHVIRPRRAEADVTDGDALARAVLAHRPDAVLDLAAFHKVELCEQDPETSFRVNAVGAIHGAGGARGARARGGVGWWGDGVNDARAL